MTSSRLIRPVLAAVIAMLAVFSAASFAQQVVPVGQTSEQPRVVPAPRTAAPAAAPALRRHEDDDQKEALIAQALDQKTNLEIKDAPIREALDLLASKTGVPIEVEPGAIGLLPYGSKTLVSVTIPDQPLRDGLAAMLLPIGLRFKVEGNHVIIRAVPPLRRAVERVTWKELDLMAKLCSSPWSDELAKSLKFQFQDSSTTAEANCEAIMHAARNVGQGAASDVLDRATEQDGWTWYPSADVVVVLPRIRQIERQLQKRITADYTQASLQDTLLDLAEKAAVPLRIDPGALAALPQSVAERFSLRIVNTPVRQVLELIAGQTGLAYFIEPEGLRIANQLAVAGAATRPADDADAIARAIKASRNSVVGQIELVGNGRKVVLFVREDDLPPDVNELRKAFLKQAGAAFRPALQPATKPAE